MRMVDLIARKKRGEELTDEEIRFFIQNYTNGTIPDYQASALCMAICFQGLTDREISTLTNEMALSGDTLDLSMFGDLSCDKHSTGGVGDKTSLIVGPIVASLGGKLAKMSGRGLGHTGGTVDKLEAIPGYKTSISHEAFLAQVSRVGMAIIGQSENMTPADKKLYALRDVTATIDSIGLIASSVMSKKLAAGAKNIVLDVKVGSGAFLKTEEEAVSFAKKAVEIGTRNRRNVVALITDMDRPLGSAVGNSLEVIEAIEVLKGNGPQDIREVSFSLASELVAFIRKIDRAEARVLVEESVQSGRAFEKMKEWISAQGGDSAYIENTKQFPKASHMFTIQSKTDGFLSAMNTEKIGTVASLLGAGRESKEDSVDLSAGFFVYKKTGDKVRPGDVLAVGYTNKENVIEDAKTLYLNALTFSSKAPEGKPLILRRIDKNSSCDFQIT